MGVAGFQTGYDISDLGTYWEPGGLFGGRNGVVGITRESTGYGVFGWSKAISGTTSGVRGVSDSTSGRGVLGFASATSGATYGVYGVSNSSSGAGVYGQGENPTYGTGVYGQGTVYGVHGWATRTTALTYGVYGQTDSTYGRGVYGEAHGTSGSTYGVMGESESTEGRGVYGIASANTGTNYGVYGRSDSPSGYGGYFHGDVHVTGDLSAGGTKPFKIDHPLDPANRYLYHYSVESSEVLNQYSGNVTLDVDGEAWVELPVWFPAINKDYRYQLTPIGASAPTLYIAQEIEDGRFKIAGGAAGLKVSWQVTGRRDDPYVQYYGAPVEVDKPAGEQGTYLYPELYGQPEELGRDYLHHQELEETVEPEAAVPDALPE
jgi:hypothetical protein